MKIGSVLAFVVFSILFTSSFSLAQKPVPAASENRVIVNRRLKNICVLDAQGRCILMSSVGIGRGGLQKKRTMDDMVTPTGTFFVDIVLAANPKQCFVSKEITQRYSGNPAYFQYLDSASGLARLFKNMNGLDFDADGKADCAYGCAYIGLSSKNAVTGPKLMRFHDTVYWYSIAMHGTSQEKKLLGLAKSGGCILLDSVVLKQLLENQLVGPGTMVTIED